MYIDENVPASRGPRGDITAMTASSSITESIADPHARARRSAQTAPENSSNDSSTKASTKAPSLIVLERELAHLVRMLEAVQRRRLYPLDRAQYLLLELLRENGPQPVANLAERLLLDSSTVTRQVAAMEQAALIDRVPNLQDGRSMLVRATRHGLQAARQMREARLERIAALFEQWPEADRARLAALLGKLNGSLLNSLSDEVAPLE